MVISHDNTQDTHLYGLEWPKSITIALVSCLVTQKSLGNWVYGSLNGPTLGLAREHINSTFNTSYNIGQVAARVKRFNLFDHMISCSGVSWDRTDNMVLAPAEQWKKWEIVYPNSRAYVAQGETLYDDLHKLFAPDVIDVDHDFIQIFDSDEDPMYDASPLPYEVPPLEVEPLLDAPPLAANVIVLSDDDVPNEVDNHDVIEISDGSDEN